MLAGGIIFGELLPALLVTPIVFPGIILTFIKVEDFCNTKIYQHQKSLKEAKQEKHDFELSLSKSKDFQPTTDTFGKDVENQISEAQASIRRVLIGLLPDTLKNSSLVLQEIMYNHLQTDEDFEQTLNDVSSIADKQTLELLKELLNNISQINHRISQGNNKYLSKTQTFEFAKEYIYAISEFCDAMDKKVEDSGYSKQKTLCK